MEVFFIFFFFFVAMVTGGFSNKVNFAESSAGWTCFVVSMVEEEEEGS